MLGPRIHAELGLSPRRRGNRERQHDLLSRLGSIPAQAGEPVPTRAAPGIRRVYPRAGGGTAKANELKASHRGLSPRRRGNLQAEGERPARVGSIPAQAGEPGLPVAPPVPVRVYPRAGGGTAVRATVVDPGRGLSPRRRGNLHRHPACRGGPGSIPAQAGEPRVERGQRDPPVRQSLRGLARADRGARHGGLHAPAEGLRGFFVLSPADTRRAMALVAHVLHTPISELDGMDVEELLEWADEARYIAKRLYR